jgi:hypothetical protein
MRDVCRERIRDERSAGDGPDFAVNAGPGWICGAAKSIEKAIGMLHASRENSSMNVHMIRAILVATLGLTLAVPSMSAFAGKAPPPPPPPPTPTSCAGVTGVGVFPAMVYSKSKYREIKRGGGTQVYDGTDFYIADSNGKCSLLISSSQNYWSHKYRQIGTEARVAWADGASIRLVKFNVVGSSVVEPLPLASTIVYTQSWTPSSIIDLELTANGQTIFYIDEIKTIDGRWVDTLHSISLTNCSANCTPQTLYTFNDDNGVGWLSVNAAGDRLYMSIHDRVPNIRSISFLKKNQDGTWSSLRQVVSNQDGDYQSVTGFAATAFGRWDYNNSSVPKNVLSYVVERTSGYTTDIVDVTNCAPATVVPQGSCLPSGESVFVRSGIAGSGSSFTSTPSSLTTGTPSLLVASGGSVIDVGLGTSAPVTLLQGGAADSAD